MPCSCQAQPALDVHVCSLSFRFAALGIYLCSPLVVSVSLPMHRLFRYTLDIVRMRLCFKFPTTGIVLNFACKVQLLSVCRTSIQSCLCFSLANSRCEYCVYNGTELFIREGSYGFIDEE